MAATLAPTVLEHMGLRRRKTDETITAVFHGVHVFQAQGVALEKGAVVEARGAISDRPYGVALGSSVNALSRILLEDDLTDNEDEWMKEQKCAPPFVLVHIGPTTEHSIAGDFLKVEESSITTYEGFLTARMELRELENSILPSLISSLTCAFSSVDNTVRFKRVTREVFGKTSDGVVVHDFGIEVRGSGYVSRGLNSGDAAVKLQNTTQLASTIQPNVARFFYLALEEEDPLKRFLYFFLTIERQTHAAFGTIDHDAHLGRMIQPQDRMRATATEFFQNQRERWTALNERFVWCSLSVWTHLTDADITTFKRLKKVRDEIAHGVIASPPADAVLAVEQLASKLQVGPSGTGA